VLFFTILSAKTLLTISSLVSGRQPYAKLIQLHQPLRPVDNPIPSKHKCRGQLNVFIIQNQFIMNGGWIKLSFRQNRLR
jgi:hypothetical protein